MANRFLLSAVLISLSVGAFAQGPAEPTGPAQPKPAAKKAAAEVPVELTDEGLERARASMDGRFASRLAGIKNSADARSGFIARIEKKRFDFERHALEERKAFYVYMKSVLSDERDKAMKDFNEKEERDRSKFDKEILTEEKNWFDNEISENWKTASLMAESAPAPRVAPTPPPTIHSKPRPKPVARKAIHKAKAKAAARKRKSRIKEEQAQEQAVEPEPAAAPTDGAPMQQAEPGDPSTTN